MPKPPPGTCGEFPALSFLFPGETCPGAQPVYAGRVRKKGQAGVGGSGVRVCNLNQGIEPVDPEEFFSTQSDSFHVERLFFPF